MCASEPDPPDPQSFRLAPAGTPDAPVRPWTPWIILGTFILFVLVLLYVKHNL